MPYRRWIPALSLSLILPVHAQNGAVPAALVQPLAKLHAVVAVGEQIVDWCDRQQPQQQAQHAQAAKAWQEGFRYAEVAARWPAPPRRPVTAERRSEFDRNLQDEAARGFRCEALKGYLARKLDPRAVDPEGHAAVMAALATSAAPPTPPTPATPALPAVPVATPPSSATAAMAPTPPVTRGWGHLKPERVQRMLAALGATPPLAVGGPMRDGTYRCLQVRPRRGWQQSHQYSLSLYADKGLRLHDITVERDDGTRSYPARELAARHVYEPANGELFAHATGADLPLVRGYAMMNSEHRSLSSEPLKIIAFRQVTDAAGRAFFAGVQEYPEESGTACAWQGPAKQASPVAEEIAAANQAELERHRFRTKAPNGGLKPEQIEGYLHITRYSTDAGGAQHAQEHSDLLLSSGWGFRNPDYSPHDFDAEASRQFEPLLWFRWRRQGGVIETTGNGAQWQRAEGVLGKAASPAQLVGLHRTMDIFGMNPYFAATVVTETWTFGADGRFSVDRGKRGGDSTTLRGRYRLDGYTLDLQFDDGSTSRRFVYAVGKRIAINGTTYLRP